MRRFTRVPAALMAASFLACGLFGLAPAAHAEDDLPPTSEFFDEYDANADGKVTKDEFRGSSEIFRLLDKDGDGVIAPADLGLPADYKPDPAAQKRRQAAKDRAARGGGAGRAMEQFRKRIMKMDADKDGRVSKAEWKGKDAGFDRMDRNKDGYLDAKDAAAMGGRDRKPQGDRAGKGDRRGKGGDAPKTPAHDPAAMEKQAKAKFATFDKNADGRLDADELPGERFLEMLDKDKDGSVSEKEFLAFAKQRGRSGRQGAGAKGDDAGKGRRRRPRMNAGMLRRWDRDKDGKVSPDEFPAGDERFARLDVDRDGFLTEADIKAAQEGRGGKGRKADGAQRATTPSAARTGNLIEVQDEDGDGRLNRTEFRGSAAEWRRLDANGDGWISADEIAE